MNGGLHETLKLNFSQDFVLSAFIEFRKGTFKWHLNTESLTIQIFVFSIIFCLKIAAERGPCFAMASWAGFRVKVKFSLIIIRLQYVVKVKKIVLIVDNIVYWKELGFMW